VEEEYEKQGKTCSTSKREILNLHSNRRQTRDSNLSQQPSSIGWDVVITLLIAIYGAVVSTYSIYASRQEHKREIKVELSYGFMRNVLGEVSPPLLILSAMNTGVKTVTLTSTGLVLPRKKYLFFAQPESNVTFPHELTEGKSCSVWIANKELAEDLRREGYSGKIKLKGYYKDAVGGDYQSKQKKFNIEKP